jgi:pyruvate formate-lyase activating enzyme-like uncharacterized protein
MATFFKRNNSHVTYSPENNSLKIYIQPSSTFNNFVSIINYLSTTEPYKNITELHILSDNIKYSITKIPNKITQFPNIEILIIENLNITKLGFSIPILEELVLINTKIKTIRDDEILLFENLVTLQISQSNVFNSLPNHFSPEINNIILVELPSLTELPEVLTTINPANITITNTGIKNDNEVLNKLRRQGWFVSFNGIEDNHEGETKEESSLLGESKDEDEEIDDFTSIEKLNEIMQKYKNKGLITRLGSGTYLANPNLFGKGEWKNIRKLLTTISYDENGRMIIMNKEISTETNEFE